MPWSETTPMDERLQFLADVRRGTDEMTVLCRRYGISRKTGYKWLARYTADGPNGLPSVPTARTPVRMRRLPTRWTHCASCGAGLPPGGRRSCSRSWRSVGPRSCGRRRVPRRRC